MHFSPKDKSLLLFICSALIVLWLVFSLLSKVFYAASFHISEVKKLSENSGEWLNSQQEIGVSNLKDRAILLHFWNRSCISCIEALPTIKKLENELGSKLTVIGVYSAKFSNGKSLSVVKNAILKHDINHLVVADFDSKLWNKFDIKAWPTFILISPTGHEYERYEGIDSLNKMEKDVKRMVSKYRYQINREVLPILPEKFSRIGNVLSFPAKLEYASNFTQNSRSTSALFIANAGQNNIIVSSLAGGMLFKIGSGREGFLDGDFATAQFRNPQATLFSDQKLYVADTGNHALRLIDFASGKVSTIIGNGNKGSVISKKTSIKNFQLASPTDLEFFPDQNKIIISNAGNNQIISFDLKNGEVSPIAGNGESGILDGQYPNNSLAQTSDMVVVGDKIYFLDAISSSLRVFDEKHGVKTLVKTDLQNPLALTGNKDVLYIADSFYNRIEKYHIDKNRIKTLVGKVEGDDVGKVTRFNSPEGILKINNSFYISDSNNNRIIVLNEKSLSSEILDVIPPLKLPREGFLEYLPNLQKSEPVSVKENKKITLTIDLNDGWKINEDGPSFINLLELVSSDKADLIASFDWYFVRQQKLNLPALTQGKDYLLQGSIYYCEDKKNSLCFVKSYEQKIKVDDDKNSEIELRLGY
jgi:thiol-disulfide isomerase/thioredoxin